MTYLQFSNFLENCYCMASVIGRGTDSCIVMTLDGWASTMLNSRIASTIFSAVSMATYMIFLWFTSMVYECFTSGHRRFLVYCFRVAFSTKFPTDNNPLLFIALTAMIIRGFCTPCTNV